MVEDGLLQLCNSALVGLDLQQVFAFDLRLLAFQFLVLPLELDDLEAEVIELLLHFLAVLQLLAQLCHGLVLFEGVDVGGSAGVARRQILPSVEFFHFIIKSNVPCKLID